MSDATLCYLSATELAARIRQRDLSPVAVTRAFLDRIAAIDGDLGAYCTVTALLHPSLVPHRARISPQE